jgi:hypothetical protein
MIAGSQLVPRKNTAPLQGLVLAQNDPKELP